MSSDRPSFPKIIEFQTLSKCNGYCTTCPYRNLAKNQVSRRMTDEMIERIIFECDEHKGEIERIIPYMNNEPSLDVRFIEVLRRIKKENHFIEVSTNFSGITEDIMGVIIKEKLIDDLRISFFGGNEKYYSELMPGLRFETNLKMIHKFIDMNQRAGLPVKYQIIAILCPWIHMEDNLGLLHNIFPDSQIHVFGFLDRAGNVAEHKNEVLYNKDDTSVLCGCGLNRPFERICILADGNAVLCSQDWGEEAIVGNVTEDSIGKVWNGKRFEWFRKAIRGEIRVGSEFICHRCKLAELVSDGFAYPNFAGDEYISQDGIKKVT